MKHLSYRISNRSVYHIRISNFLVSVCFCIVSFSLYGQEDASHIFANAEMMRKSGDFIRAIDEYDRAIAKDAKDYRFHYAKALCYVSLKDYDNAISTLTDLSKVKPDYVMGYVTMAKCYQEQDRFLKVAESYDLAFKYESDTKKKVAYKLNTVEYLISKDKNDISLKHIQDAKNIDPSNFNVLYYEGYLYNKQKKYAEAKAALIKSTELLPSKEPKIAAKYFYELGYAYAKLREYEKATEAFKKANFGPYKPLIAKLSPEYYMAAANSYMSLGDLEEAKRLINIAIQMNPDFSKGYVFLATLSQRQADQTHLLPKKTQKLLTIFIKI
jgi:tetratricopeptide (TPR) repeat protein